MVVRIDIDNFKFTKTRIVFQVEFLNIRLYGIQIKRVILYVYKLVYLDWSKEKSKKKMRTSTTPRLYITYVFNVMLYHWILKIKIPI